MRACFLARLLPEDKKLYSMAKSGMISSVSKFILAEIAGLNQILDVPLDIFAVVDVPAFPSMRKIFFRNKKIKDVKYMGFINFPGFRMISAFNNIFYHINLWIRADKNERNIIFAYSLKPSFVFSLFLAKKLYPNTVICLAVGDLFQVDSKGYANKNLFFKLSITKYVRYAVEKCLKIFDCFVFVTDKMAETLGLSDKPYVVIEGMYNSKDTINYHKNSNTNDKKIIFMAGTMDAQFGSIRLIDAFMAINDPSFELWLAGSELKEGIINEKIKNDKRIKYFGFVSPTEVAKLQSKATILINPRTNQHEYVKYSFPSKTMECLASGKPFIGYKLDCFPPEYDEYIQYVPNNSIQALTNKIVEIASLPKEERESIGAKSRKFILEQKSSKAQCQKIKNMIDSLI